MPHAQHAAKCSRHLAGSSNSVQSCRPDVSRTLLRLRKEGGLVEGENFAACLSLKSSALCLMFDLSHRYGRETQLRREQDQDAVFAGAHPAAHRHVHRAHRQRQSLRRRLLHPAQGGRGQRHRRIHHGPRQGGRDQDRGHARVRCAISAAASRSARWWTAFPRSTPARNTTTTCSSSASASTASAPRRSTRSRRRSSCAAIATANSPRRRSSSGKLKKEETGKTKEPNGTFIEFEPDPEIFKETEFKPEHVERRLRHYSYLNTGLRLILQRQGRSSRATA